MKKFLFFTTMVIPLIIIALIWHGFMFAWDHAIHAYFDWMMKE